MNNENPIKDAVAKLLTIKNVVILIIVIMGIYFIAKGKIEMAILSSLFSTAVSLTLQSKD